MSASAGLSAARRRRIGSTSPNTIVNQNNRINESNQPSPTESFVPTPMQILENHELRLRAIENNDLNKNIDVVLNELNELKKEYNLLVNSNPVYPFSYGIYVS